MSQVGALDGPQLYTAGRRLLLVVRNTCTTAGIDLPEAVFVAPGSSPVWDGEQLTVQLVRLVNGMPGAEDSGWVRAPAGVQSAEWQVTLLRATPIVSSDEILPTEEELEASAVQNLGDTAAFQQLARLLVSDEKLFGGLGVPLIVTAPTPVGPAGGLVGVQLNVTHSLIGWG